MSTAKGERLRYLHESRKALHEVPCDKLFELPGRPNVLFTIRDYSYDRVKGAADARAEAAFLFKAFETGQIGPRRLQRMLGEHAPRNATIHEYLDWTVTAVEAQDETEYDFSGFRLILLYPRERNMWPPPAGSQPQARAHAQLGAPLDPWPGLAIKGRPLTAATIRAGPGYLEVPFVATQESKRGRGFGRCMVEAIEGVARALGCGRLLLCSTAEANVQSTWRRLGFVETTEPDLAALDVQDPDLVHMQNTVQMHKVVPPPRRWRAVRIKHEAFVARNYCPLDRPGLGAHVESFAVGMTQSDPLYGAGGGGGASSDYVSGSLGGGGGGGAPRKGREGTPLSGAPPPWRRDGDGKGGSMTPRLGMSPSVTAADGDGGAPSAGAPPRPGHSQQQGGGPQWGGLARQPSGASSDALLWGATGEQPQAEAMEVG